MLLLRYSVIWDIGLAIFENVFSGSYHTTNMAAMSVQIYVLGNLILK